MDFMGMIYNSKSRSLILDQFESKLQTWEAPREWVDYVHILQWDLNMWRHVEGNTPWNSNILNPKSWRFGSDDFPFQLDDL